MSTMEMAVLKGGTSVFENKGGVGINQEKTNIVMGHVVELQQSGLAVVVTASGAVPEGRERCVERGIDYTQLTSPQLARRGTAGQMRHFEIAGDLYGIEVTQNLATHLEIDNKAEGKTITKEISKDAYGGAVAILNENPTAGNDETKKYDEDQAEKETHEEDNADTNNDWLACHFAIAARAEYVILLSDDVDGFEGDNGEVVERITTSQISKLLAKHERQGYKGGTGGPGSKLWAMARAAMALPDSKIIFGNAHRSPLAMTLGECICTRVVQ